MSMYYLDLNTKNLHSDTGDKYLLNGLAIVVSPHQDDESIGMGGTIALLIEKGFVVYYIFTTIESSEAAQLRKDEATSAVMKLGGDIKNIKFLDFIDGQLKLHTLKFSDTVSVLKKEIRRIELKENVIEILPFDKENQIDSKHTIILTTSRYDGHRDHEETFNMIKNGTRKKIIVEFPVVNHMLSDFKPNCYIPLPTHILEMKKEALMQYSGEEIRGRIMWEDIDSLLRKNGSQIGVEKAESCFISWYGYINPIN